VPIQAAAAAAATRVKEENKEGQQWRNVESACHASRRVSRPGDRVATLAFNTVRHLEAW
jgi:hypothetical protein